MEKSRHVTSKGTLFSPSKAHICHFWANKTKQKKQPETILTLDTAISVVTHILTGTVIVSIKNFGFEKKKKKHTEKTQYSGVGSIVNKTLLHSTSYICHLHWAVSKIKKKTSNNRFYLSSASACWIHSETELKTNVEHTKLKAKQGSGAQAFIHCLYFLFTWKCGTVKEYIVMHLIPADILWS